jgi:hypothetical protein
MSFPQAKQIEVLIGFRAKVMVLLAVLMNGHFRELRLDGFVRVWNSPTTVHHLKREDESNDNYSFNLHN